MSAIDELVAIGQSTLEAERLATSAAETEKVAERIADRTRRIEAVRAALGLDIETFGKFNPEYKDGWSPNVLLTWQGDGIGFVVDRDGKNAYSVRSGNRSTGHIEYLAREMARILNEHEAFTAATLRDLQVAIDAGWVNDYAGAKRAAVWNTPEVIEARVRFLLGVQRSGVFNDYPNYMKNWLGFTAELPDAAELSELRPDVERHFNRWQLRSRLLDCIQRRLDPETGKVLGIDNNWDEDHGQYSDVVTLEEVAAYAAGANKAGLADDDQVKAAIAVRVREMEQANLKAVIEEKRQMLEREMFRPFTYFTVRFGVLGVDEDGARELTTESFDSLTDTAGDDGYWTTVRGKRVRPTFVALIERMEVNTIDDLKQLNWRYVLKRSTEYGEIYVSPQMADVTR